MRITFQPQSFAFRGFQETCTKPKNKEKFIDIRSVETDEYHDKKKLIDILNIEPEEVSQASANGTFILFLKDSKKTITKTPTKIIITTQKENKDVYMSITHTIDKPAKNPYLDPDSYESLKQLKINRGMDSGCRSHAIPKNAASDPNYNHKYTLYQKASDYIEELAHKTLED